MNEISQKQISDYIKLLVEFGGVYTVDPEYYIFGPDKERVQIVHNKKAVPVKIFNDRMMTGDWVFLNPFNETLTASTERHWFWQSQSIILGYMLKRMLESLVEKLQSDNDDLHIGELELAKQLVGQVDDKTLASLMHLKADDYGVIFFHKKSKTAQFQCRMFETEFRESMKGKLRKKDWSVVTMFLEHVLQTSEPERVYMHTGTIISLMEAEATLNVLTKLTEAVAPYMDAILGVKLPVLEMQQHLSLLDKYHKLTMWHQPATKAKATMLGTKLPWEVQEDPGVVRMPGAPKSPPIDNGTSNNRGIRMASQLLPAIPPPPPVQPLQLGGMMAPIIAQPSTNHFVAGGVPSIGMPVRLQDGMRISAFR